MKVVIDRETLERLYWKERKTQHEIAKKLGVSRSCIEYYIHKYNLTRPRGKPFDMTKVEDLSYIIGVLLGDGHVRISKEDNSGIIVLHQKRKEFAESFYRALESIGLNPSKRENSDGFWVVYAYSRPFVEWYKSLSIEEIEHLVKKSKKTMIAFVRGFYESEGCNEVRSPHWRIHIYNSRMELLQLLKRILQQLGLNFRLRKVRDGMYELRSCDKRQNLYFMEIIKPCIKNEILGPKLKRWSKERVIKEIRALAKKLGRAPKVMEIRDNYPALYGACQRHFGKCSIAVEVATNE